MNIIRWTWKSIVSFLGGCLATAKSTGTPDEARPVSVEQKLDAAADAFSVIESITNDGHFLDVADIKRINQKALEAYRAIKK